MTNLLKRIKESRAAIRKTSRDDHTILVLGVDRNVREAYLFGLVFAAYANDDKVDEKEKDWLFNLGKTLGFDEGDLSQAIECVGDEDDAGKMALIEDCARQITDPKVADCFLAEFSTLWKLGEGEKELFAEFRNQLIAWMGDEVAAADEAKAKAAEAAKARRKEAERKKAIAKKEAERKRRVAEELKREKAKIAGFFDSVAEVVDGLGVTDEIRTNDDMLSRMSAKLKENGLDTVDAIGAYRAIRHSFISKMGAVIGARMCRIKSCKDGYSIQVRREQLEAYKRECAEMCKLHYYVSWALIALCVLKKHVTDADVSQFNGLLRHAHSWGKSSFSNDNPSYFWSIYLHKRAETVLGLPRVDQDKD